MSLLWLPVGVLHTQYELARPSAIRNAEGSPVEPKYKGIRISRKDVFGSEEVEEDGSSHLKDGSSYLGSEDERGGSDASEEKAALESGEEDSPPSPKNDPRPVFLEQVSDLASTLQKSRNQDRLKGQAISKQLVCSLSPSEFLALSSSLEEPLGCPHECSNTSAERHCCCE